MGSQKLKWQPRGFHWSVPDPLNISYSCYLGVLVGLLMGVRWFNLSFFYLFLEFFSSYWVSLFSLHMRTFALSYYTLFCPVWLFVSSRFDIFRRNRWGVVSLKEDVGAARRSWGRENMVEIDHMWENCIFNK